MPTWHDLVARHGSGEVEHMENLIGALTLEIIGRAAFGASIGGMSEIRRDADLLVKAFTEYMETLSNVSAIEMLPGYR